MRNKLTILMALSICLTSSLVRAADLVVFSRNKIVETNSIEGINVFAKMDNKAVAMINRGSFSVLKSIDPDAEIIETNSDINYLWVANNPNPPGTPLYRTASNSLLKIPFAEAQGLLASGIRLSKCLLMNLPPDRKVSEYYPQHQGQIISDIDSLMALVSVDSVRAYIQRLQDFQTRYSNTDSFWAAADWVTEKFQSWGYDSISAQQFNIWNIHSCNIIATRVGDVYPDRVIVIGGHFDSVVYDGGNPNVFAPGADDNGSGTAFTLEIARVLASTPLKKTVKFITFGAEEQGLFGSEAYVQDALQRHENIELMINADMIGNVADSYLNYSIKINENGSPYGYLLADLINDYTNLIPDIQLGEFSGSDHYPFDQAGFRTVYSEEGDFSPNWHLQSDVIANMDIPYMTEIVRCNLGLLLLSTQMPMPISGLRVRSAGDGHTAYLNWDPIDDPDIAKYYIYRGDTRNALNLVDSSIVAYDTLYGIPENMLQYYAVKAVNLSGDASLIEQYATLTLSSQPTRPDTLVIMPEPNQLRICWTRSPDLDFDYYQVYRRVGPDGELMVYRQISNDTMFIDPSLQSNTRYYYNIATVDTMSLSSERSHTDYSKVISFDSGLLMVDETRDGNGSQGLPTDAQQDSFYSYLTRNYRVTFHDIANEGALRINDIGPFSAIAWMDEDVYNHNLANFDSPLGQYLSFGGNLLIVGWREFFSYGSVRPMAFLSGSFPHDYLRIDTVNCRTSWDFSGASGVDGLPNLNLLPERVLPSWNGLLLGVDVMSIRDSVDVIYTYNSQSGDTLTQGRPAGIAIYGNGYKCINLSFPLWQMPPDSADIAFQRAMEFLGEPVSIAGDDIGVSPLPEMTLMPNFPNPFNSSTSLSYYLATAGETELEIYNLLGQKVVNLAHGRLESGWHRITWNASGLSSGIYFIRLSGANRTLTRKMILMK